MASGALFGNSTSRSGSKNLLEFRAGKMHLRGNMVHPDERKGLVYLHQSDESLMHLCWKDRTTGVVEDDLIIFPEDCEFRRLTQCTTGRVYLLKFKNSPGKKFFFWMQEPKTDKDDDNCKRVNDLLNNPPAPGSSGSSSSRGQDLQNVLGNMSQQELMQLLNTVGMGGMGGLSGLLGNRGGNTQSDSTSSSRAASAATTRPTPVVAEETTQPPAATAMATARDAANIQLTDLQSILSGMTSSAGGTAEAKPVDLAKAINPEIMLPLLANADVQERLQPFLPDNSTIPSTQDELRETITSPQFQQAMGAFSAALASGQLGPLMGQFGLGDAAVAAATEGDVEAFAKALQDSQSAEKKPEPKKD